MIIQAFPTCRPWKLVEAVTYLDTGDELHVAKEAWTQLTRASMVEVIQHMAFIHARLRILNELPKVDT